jgi:hypothetical protein
MPGTATRRIGDSRRENKLFVTDILVHGGNRFTDTWNRLLKKEHAPSRRGPGNRLFLQNRIMQRGMSPPNLRPGRKNMRDKAG